MRRIGWGILLVVRSPLHGVIDFSRHGLVRRLCRILFYFLFCLEIDGEIFGVMASCAVVVHAVWRFECVRPSAMATAMVRSSASLAALCGSLVEISLVPFLRRCSKKFLLIFWRPTTIGIDVVYWFRVASLIFIVVRSCGFVGF
jgi:hypothetical protein